MLPPPTPFKFFVLAASVFEMRLSHFLAAIFAGRFVRFFILAILTIKFGPQFVEFAGGMLRQHALWVLLGVAFVLIVIALLWWRRSRSKPE